MKKRLLYGLLLTALGLNLFLGARIYFSYAQAGEKEDVYQNIELFTACWNACGRITWTATR